ncbi:MAG: DNA ligase-associated metallophosphoesterase [Akkermansiaceae bacterium]|jgi:DNA ligase-associated metallophosphoesterase
MEILLGETQAELLPGRAVFLPQSKTLIVADLHLGKSATFRKRGLPVPEGTTKSDLDRLAALLKATQPTQLIVAGDLVHSADGLNETILTTIEDFFGQLPIPTILTEGNHDSRAWISQRKLPFQILPQLRVDEITITHDPADLNKGEPGIAGHLHPGVRIRDTRRTSLRIPGFFLKAHQHLILPAFSEFTGIHPMSLESNDRFFGEIRDQIQEIPPQLIR